MAGQNFNVADTFRIEAKDTLDALEQSLNDLDAGQADPDTINTIFRAAHTLKGSALMVERHDIGELAHVLEELFVRWRDGRLTPTASQTRWSLEAVEMLRTQLEGESQETLGQAGNGPGQATASGAMLRVAQTDVDSLLSLVGELVLTHGRMTANVTRLGAQQRQDVQDILDEYAALHASLRDQVMKLRLVTLAPLLSRLRQTAHSVARNLGKELDFEVKGAEQLLDTSLVEGLRDPFMHLVRNALDHGLETPDERTAKGKTARGRLSLQIKKASGSVQFSLADDGRGLDREKIAKKARERGRQVEAAALTAADLEAFIFEAGFSTAERVTEVSGRGVGMDVVRKNIDALRGTIQVSSQTGVGTTFTISVPLDITILDCMLVEAGPQHFVLPEERVLEFIDMPSPMTSELATLHVRGQTLPCIRLAALLGDGSAAPRQTLLIVAHAGGRVGLVVDRSHGTQQLVVRSVGPLLRSLPVVAGAAVLGSGDIALLLDVDKVIEASARRWTVKLEERSSQGSMQC